jgi:ABC-type uncharacterized transport system YnjBCD substrate-binding protein
MHGTRKVALSIVVLGLVVAACSSSKKAGTPAAATSATGTVAAGSAAAGTKPAHPVTLNILDIAGNLQLTQGMIDNFVKANSDVISKVTYTKAAAPAMAGKLQAEQQGGESQTGLVLTGTDGLSAGIAQKLLAKLLPDHAADFPNLMANYQQPAAAMQDLAQGFGIELVYYPSGPLLEYNPSAVTTPPASPQDLLDWAKAHSGKFAYAQPRNSGPGRTLLMGLPYLLGDKDPKDPINGWDKTWAYLQELNKYVTYYPSGTTENMKNLASGAVDMVASTTGWDINPRALGTVPDTEKVAVMQPMHWVSDAQYAIIPKGVSNDVLAADLLLIAWMLKPDQQAIAYDKGYFYPGPAVKGVTLAMAPKDSQDTIAKFGRPDYDGWISKYPVETSLPAAQQVAAFDKWDQLVGNGKKKS